MHRTTIFQNESKLTATLPQLMEMLGTGRSTAEKIAAASGAGIQIGRRRVFLLSRIEKYLEQIADSNEKT